MKNLLLLITNILFLSSCTLPPLTSTDTTTSNYNIDKSLKEAEVPFDLQGIEAKLFQDIKYGASSLNTFDILIPASNRPTALLIYIHGGGFLNGTKKVIYKNKTRDFHTENRTLLSNNIAIASIDYRLLQTNETEGVIKSLTDCKRALQYIRSRATDFNIDKNNIILAGSSAGAGSALWIATNDDMKDETNADEILHESTRVKGIALRETQCSYNLETVWINDVFSPFNITWDELLQANKDRIFQFYGVSSLAEYNKITDYRNSVDMLSLMTSDDPPFYAENLNVSNLAPQNTGNYNHHPFHAKELKEKADALGIDNVCYYGNPVLYSDKTEESYLDFIIRISKQ